MAEHVWTVFCSRLVTDRETNQVSLYDVIESLTAAGPQQLRADALSGESVAVRFQGTLASLWKRSNREVPEIARCRGILFDGAGRELLPYQEYQIDLTEKRRTRAQLKLEALPLRGEGEYTFQVEHLDNGGEWRIVAQVPFEVTIEVKAEGDEEAPRKPRSKRTAKAKRRRK